MNRKILYKARPLGPYDINTWIFGSLLYIDDLYYVIPKNVSIPIIDMTNYLVEPNTIREFTGFYGLRSGIRDLVWEGDKVKIDDEICKVEFSMLFGGWVCTPKNGTNPIMLAPLNEIIELLPDKNVCIPYI